MPPPQETRTSPTPIQEKNDEPMLPQIKQEPIWLSSDEDEPPPPPPPKKNEISPMDIIACINKAIGLKRKVTKVETIENRRAKSKEHQSSKETMQYRNESYLRWSISTIWLF